MRSFVPDRDRDLILALVIGNIDEHQFSAAFAGNPAERAVEWLRRSAEARDDLGAELALHLGHRFGFEASSLPWLHQLLVADWHQHHEDIVDALAKLSAPESVDVLCQTAKARFSYRDYDESRSLGAKCVRALGRVGTVEAVRRLGELASSNDPILAERSARMLRRLARESDSDAVRDAAASALK